MKLNRAGFIEQSIVLSKRLANILARHQFLMKLSVVQWLEQGTVNPLMQVRFLPVQTFFELLTAC